MIPMPSGRQILVPTASEDVAVGLGLDVGVAAMDVVAVGVELRARKMGRRRVLKKRKRLMMKKRILSESASLRTWLNKSNRDDVEF